MPASIRGSYGNRGCEAHEVDFDDSTALTQRSSCVFAAAVFFIPRIASGLFPFFPDAGDPKPAGLSPDADPSPRGS